MKLKKRFEVWHNFNTRYMLDTNIEHSPSFLFVMYSIFIEIPLFLIDIGPFLIKEFFKDRKERKKEYEKFKREYNKEK